MEDPLINSAPIWEEDTIKIEKNVSSHFKKEIVYRVKN
jgi:hypothetical protein